MYEYLFGSAIFSAIWIIFYFLRMDLRNQMIFSSLLSLPLGTLEILFIPYYWNPERLFNFNPAIESFLLMFSIGGIVSVLYEIAFRKQLKKLNISRYESKKINRLIGISIIISIFIFSFILKNNFILTFSITMFLGSAASVFARKYLFKKIFFSGISFLLIYLLFLLFMNHIIFPDWIEKLDY